MDKQQHLDYLCEAAEWSLRSGVDVTVSPHGSVEIVVHRTTVAMLEGHQADAFLDEAKFLWEELEEIALDWMYLALAKPYVENSI